MGHNTSRCSLFRDLVQKGLNESRLKFRNKSKPQMQVDSDPLNEASIVNTDIAGCNMVEAKANVGERQMVGSVRNPEDNEEFVTKFQSDKQLVSDITPEQKAWNRIVAYLDENEIKKALKAKLQQKMVVGTIEKGTFETFTEEPKEMMVEGQKLDCVFDDGPLGFEKDPSIENKKIQAQYPLEKIDLGDGSVKRPTYVSSEIGQDFKTRLTVLLRKYKDCFTWN